MGSICNRTQLPCDGLSLVLTNWCHLRTRIKPTQRFALHASNIEQSFSQVAMAHILHRKLLCGTILKEKVSCRIETTPVSLLGFRQLTCVWSK